MNVGDVWTAITSGLSQWSWFSDTLDVIIMAFLLYKLIVWTKETRAFEVLKGIALLFVCSVCAQLLALNTLTWLLDAVLRSGSIIIILFILFQPEIRRVLEKLGRSGKRIGKAFAEMSESMRSDIVDDLQRTILRMSKRRVGALLVFEQRTGLADIISTGTLIEGNLSGALIENIFEPNTPLHDGAVIIRGASVVAAGCFLPLSDDYDVSRELGTRHRAALGVSTVSDCMVLVISEETGAISLAREGKLMRYLDTKALRNILEGLFLKPTRVVRAGSGRAKHEEK